MDLKLFLKSLSSVILTLLVGPGLVIIFLSGIARVLFGDPTTMGEGGMGMIIVYMFIYLLALTLGIPLGMLMSKAIVYRKIKGTREFLYNLLITTIISFLLTFLVLTILYKIDT